ncbi:MAG: hypothetical protein U1A78_34940 [Polyangia bacterium]
MHRTVRRKDRLSGARWLGLGAVLIGGGCSLIWDGFKRPDPANCVTSGLPCAEGELCNPVSQICEKAPLPDLRVADGPSAADLASPAAVATPLVDLLAPADLRTAVVTSGGSRSSPALAIPVQAWDDAHGNDEAGYSQATGRFTYSAATRTAVFAKKERAACSSGTAPSCTTQSDYANTDYNLFPNDPRLKLRLRDLVSLQVRVRQTTLTGFPGMESACGIGLAFGGDGPHRNATDLSKDMRIKPSRYNDQLRFLVEGGGTDALQVDLPINGFEPGSVITQNASYSTPDFDFIRNGVLQAGSYIEYELRLVPNLVAGQFTLTLTPMDLDGDGAVTNSGTIELVPQSVTWSYTAAADATSGSQPRGGILFGSGGDSLSRADFEASSVGIGLVASGRGIGRCEFRELRVTSR